MEAAVEVQLNQRIWISIVTAIGAFSVSLLSIYLGFRLFMAGATGQFKFTAQAAGGSVGLESVAPGLAFATFGAGVAIYALRRLIAK
jgi:hypothetical protein